ncbi:hypothetical protein MMC29_006051, partial [Sticta canariensis]|nr:hypothetical protein [Sticta canariensis]
MRLLFLTVITAVIAIAIPINPGSSEGSSGQPAYPNGEVPDVTWDTMPIPQGIPGWRPVEEKDTIGERPGDWNPRERYTSGADGHDGRWSVFQDLDPAQVVGDTLNLAADGVGAFAQFTGLDKLGAAAAGAVGALGLSGFNPLPATSPA